MPRVRKPYAVTAMSHIIHIAAMLGIHWKVFRREENVYLAEGNGLLLSGRYDGREDDVIGEDERQPTERVNEGGETLHVSIQPVDHGGGPGLVELNEKGDGASCVEQLKSPSTAESRKLVWCWLVFRMLCWLQLHEFHRDDAMLPRGELMGSRLPVYIF